MHAYEARQKEYALNGHRHFYFMTLDGSEVESSSSFLISSWCYYLGLEAFYF